MTGKYDDIIDLPHHVSTVHPQMPMSDRAAQFAPFSALTGYEDAIAESARLTQSPFILTEEEQALLDAKLRYLRDHIESRPLIELEIYVPDERKEGGCYQSLTAHLRQIDPHRQSLHLTNGTAVPISHIRSLTLLPSPIAPP